MLLYEVMKYCHNFFVDKEARMEGKFSIENGTISLPLLRGQFFLVEGSVLNDGIFQYPPSNMSNEVFSGAVVPLKIPKAFLELVEDIKKYNESSEASLKNAAFQSENLSGVYSYTRATNAKGNAVTWKDVFADRLNVWRKI